MNPNVPIRRYLAAVERHINGKVERALPTPESCPEDRTGDLGRPCARRMWRLSGTFFSLFWKVWRRVSRCWSLLTKVWDFVICACALSLQLLHLLSFCLWAAARLFRMLHSTHATWLCGRRSEVSATLRKKIWTFLC